MRGIAILLIGSLALGPLGCAHVQHQDRRREAARRLAAATSIAPMLDGELGVDARFDLLKLLHAQQMAEAQATLNEPYPWFKSGAQIGGIAAILGGVIWAAVEMSSRETTRIDTGGGDYIGRDGTITRDNSTRTGEQ